MSLNSTHATLSFLLIFLTLTTTPTTTNASLYTPPPTVLRYHHGPLLKGNLTVNLIWYGRFSPSQRSIVVDFINSLSPSSSSSPSHHHPSASSWWRTTDKYTPHGPTTSLSLGRQSLLPRYPLGKSLTTSHLLSLASPRARPGPGEIDVVLTAEDVGVEGFCMRCGAHGSRGKGRGRGVYVWVGNAAAQCAGECAWPFYRPMYGPQTAPLVAPNGDVGVDGMIINLATLLAGAVTNPYSDGYFQGPATAPLEAVSACTGVFGTGAYPGYPGSVLVDGVSGASFNAYGVNGRKFLLPAMWDPMTSTCSTLV
ncbi:hypothetical protein vseg_006975 [Gypsophila vaccaria]